jgi:cysteine desulfurase
VVSVSDVEAAIRPETVLITIMHANNEVGSIQPVEEIARIAKRHNITVHTDAAQSLGKVPTDVNHLGVDLLSVAGHKLYAPKGIGALFIKEPLSPEIFCHGAGQEMGKRAGTENVMQIVGLGKACELAKNKLEQNRKHLRITRDRLEEGLTRGIPHVRTNGHPEKRLPNTLSLSFKGLEADRILEEIGLEVAVSPGAACHSDRVTVSHVLQAMDVPEEWARGTIRFSTGRMTTAEEIEKTVSVVTAAVKKLSN